MADATEMNVGGEPPGFVERIAEALGRHSGAHLVYAPPVERNGMTVIPVARVRYGFGGGGGRGTERKRGAAEARAGGGKDAGEAAAQYGEGFGAGGGVQVSPVGFIAMRGEDVEYRRIPDMIDERNLRVGVMLGGGLAAWLLLRGVRALLRR